MFSWQICFDLLWPIFEVEIWSRGKLVASTLFKQDCLIKRPIFWRCQHLFGLRNICRRLVWPQIGKQNSESNMSWWGNSNDKACNQSNFSEILEKRWWIQLIDPRLWYLDFCYLLCTWYTVDCHIMLTKSQWWSFLFKPVGPKCIVMCPFTWLKRWISAGLNDCMVHSLMVRRTMLAFHIFFTSQAMENS